MITLRLYTYVPTPWMKDILDYYYTAIIMSDRVVNEWGDDSPYWVYLLK